MRGWLGILYIAVDYATSFVKFWGLKCKVCYLVKIMLSLMILTCHRDLTIGLQEAQWLLDLHYKFYESSVTQLVLFITGKQYCIVKRLRLHATIDIIWHVPVVRLWAWCLKPGLFQEIEIQWSKVYEVKHKLSCARTLTVLLTFIIV